MAWRETFRPLMVTAHLRTGIVCDRWLPLDAVLLYQAARDKFGAQDYTVPGGGRSPDNDVRVPLQIAHPGEPHWYYACSWAQPQPWWIAEGRDYWNKRFDTSLASLVDMHGKRFKVATSAGAYKLYHMPVFYKAALRIEWYCVGDRDDVAMLLSAVTHLGKKRSQGWGRVSRWEVIPWEEDWAIWREGRLTRGVPWQDVAERGGPTNLMLYGVRPSYYRRENQMPLAMP